MDGNTLRITGARRPEHMTRQRDGNPDAARMTMRVSRDGGRSWGPTRYVQDTKTIEDDPLRFPPCGCGRTSGHRCLAARVLALTPGGRS